MASVFISSPAEVVIIDSRTRSGTVTLPLTNSIPYRILNFKDQYGTFSNSTLTLTTQNNETFDDGTTSKVFSNAFTYASLYAISSKWMVLNATQTVQQTISSLNVNQINFGTGAGWIQFGPIQASVVSTQQLNTNAAYINTDYVNSLLLGNSSNVTAVQYWGTAGNYNNTVLAEISTGTSQEFLIFRGSTTTDRVRVQTTGNFVVETGVSSRLWNSNTTATLSNATPAFIINTSSNVGIQTATPQTTLDVAGTTRAQILSTLALQTSSINGFTLGTPASSVALFTSNTSNYYANLLQNYSTMFSTAVSTVALFTSNTSNYYSNLLQNWSTSDSTISLFTSNTSNYYSNLLQNWSTSVSSVALFTSNTSNYYSNTLQNYSTAVSSVALFTSNTSNYAKNILQDWSTPQNTIYAFASNTSNYYSSLLLYDASTVITSSLTSTVTNLGFAGYISSAQLVSSVTFLLSNSGGASQTVINSTIIGLGTFQYISSLSLQSTVTSIFNSAVGLTQETLTSSIEGLGTLGYISSVNVTSTFFVNSDNAIILPSYASYTISTGYDYVSAPWGSDLAPLILTKTSFNQLEFSTADTYLAYTGSNQQDFRITYTCGGNDRETTVKPTLTLLISDPSAGIIEYQTINANEMTGASVSLIKTLNQSNTVYFYLRGLSNYTFTSNDLNMYQINIESIQPLTVDTFSSIRISSLSLYDPSTFTYRAITISAGSIYVDGNLAGASGSGGGTALTAIPSSLSTFAMFTSSLQASTIRTNLLFASTLQTQSVLTSSLFTSSLITSTAYLSSFTALTGAVSSLVVSSLTAFTENVSSLNVSTLSSFFTNTSTLTTTQINFGSGFGYLMMPDIQPNTVYTSTTTTSNLFIGFNSNQSYAGFFGAGAYQNSVIFESNIGGANQELAFFRGNSASDRLRFQTTGYIVFEPGVASRTFPSVGSNATPALVITTASNVGIQTFAPSFPLDVTGTARATTSFSTLLVQTSNIQTTGITTTTLNAISSFVNSAIVSNAFFANGSTFLQGGVSTSFLMGSVGEIRLNTSNTTRMYITSAGNIGIGLTNPSYQVHITSNLYASSMIASSIVASSITSFLTLSSVQTFTSSLTGNSFGATTMSGCNIYSSTFTGKWNDALYLTLQEI